jgi:head-tail adaptor
MSAGVRGYRVRLFRHSDAATDGLSAPSYAYVRTVWASYLPLSGAEGAVADAGVHSERAQLLVDRNVSVPRRGLVKVGDRYFAVVVVQPPRPGTQRVVLEWTDQATYTLTGEPA